jgi:hypothetical protein
MPELGRTIVRASISTLTAVAAFLCAAFPLDSQAATVNITIDTSTLAGDSGQLAFDLIDGGPPDNSVVISQLSMSGGSLGLASFTGAASETGPASFLLNDTSFFNEVLIPLTIGTQITFKFDDTDLGPVGSSIPDSLTVFLLDSSGIPLIPTADPTGGDALLQFDAGTHSTIPFSSIVTLVTTTPEPRHVVLPLGILFAFLCRKVRKSV